MKVTIVAGARPNFMKIAPLCRAINTAHKEGKDIAYRLVYTGTADDTALDPALFADLGIAPPDCCLGVPAGTQSEVSASIMLAFEKELDAHPAQVVLVVDDLASTMSCSIVAKKRGLKVAHVIAGTRSFDMNMPREVNRTIVDAISDYLFTAGMVANRNLNQEGMIPEYIHYVGNILIDNIRYCHRHFLKPVWSGSMGLSDKGYLLVTLNRRELTSNLPLLRRILSTILEQADGMPIVAPLHTYVQDAVAQTGISAQNLHVMPTQSYLHFGYLMEHAKGIVTDSGNIAEEATFLDVPCISLNTYAEHPETWRMGTNVLVGDDTESLAASLKQLTGSAWRHATLPDRWDGRTAERIVQVLINGGQD